MEDYLVPNQKFAVVALVGAPNSGKSTLMNILSTLMKPTEGAIHLNHKLLDKLNPRAVRRLIGYVGHPTMTYGDLTGIVGGRIQTYK